MYQFTENQFSNFFNYLETLDCYIKSEEGMIEEIAAFQQNPNRHIAALVCQNISEVLTYPAPYIRILYVLSGSINIYLDGKKMTYEKGCLILANKWTEVDYKENTKDTMVVSFYFKPEYFSDSLLNQMIEEPMLYRFFVESITEDTEIFSHYCVYQFNEWDDVHFYVLLLLKQVVKMRYFNNKVTKSAFILLIVEISQMSEKCLLLQDSNISAGVLIKEILGYISNNVRIATLTNVAHQFHFHPNYLSAMIKKQTGRSYSDWLTYYRLEQAKRYLEQTNLSIQTIIKEVGYSDKTFFFKRFKTYCKMTPGNYRKNFNYKYK
ncbi:helix-turn-helix domain-containing protein [Enterococcus faecium]|nr:helix-turn-helix transcriptional regulator [Enterococcus faecium]